jgi:site-specific DNA recombinase
VKRLAFYGRVSTEDQQDPDASRGWQLIRARQLVEPAGCNIVDEYFDLGTSRSLPWKRRPEAARLLADLSNPGRGFEGVVIGEPQRAFYGNQFSLTFRSSPTTEFSFGFQRSAVLSTLDPKRMTSS